MTSPLLVRDGAKAVALRPPLRLVTSLDQIASDARLDAVINLAGEPIADALWTRASGAGSWPRACRMTRNVVGLIATARTTSGRSDQRLGHRLGTGCGRTSGSPSSTAASAASAIVSATPGSVPPRRPGDMARASCALRIGLVLGIDGGMLSRLLTPFEFGLGGPIGSGRQWMSWIERDDLVRLIAHAIATPRLTGALNATAPLPVPNATFAAELARALGRPPASECRPGCCIASPAILPTSCLLGGQCVLPDKADATGFTFRHETLRGALAAMLGRRMADDRQAFARSAKIQEAR